MTFTGTMTRYCRRKSGFANTSVNQLVVVADSEFQFANLRAFAKDFDGVITGIFIAKESIREIVVIKLASIVVDKGFLPLEMP